MTEMTSQEAMQVQGGGPSQADATIVQGVNTAGTVRATDVHTFTITISNAGVD